MRDLTKGSISVHILAIAAPVLIGLLAQIAYQLVTLYFVSKIGVSATAGLGVAGNVVFAIAPLAQVLATGAVSLIAHAIGRKDQADADLIFNQSLILSAILGVIVMASLYLFLRPYLLSIAADTATMEAAETYLYWVLPGYTLLLPMAVLGAALRAAGIVQPVVAVYALTVLINAILASCLITDMGVGMALGIKGAGLATSISSVIGCLALAACFRHLQPYMEIRRELLRPQHKQWIRLLAIGLPVSSESILIFSCAAVIYYSIRDFGAIAQAGFGIGSIVLNTLLLPGVSVGVAVCSIAGQNFGAKNGERVREAFHQAALVSIGLMALAGVLVHWQAQWLADLLIEDETVSAVAAVFLKCMSLGFMAQGLVYVCSAMFQALGNTMPLLISCSAYFAVFAIPAVWLSTQPGFHIEQIWHVSIASVTVQSVVSLWLLQVQLRRLPDSRCDRLT